MTLAEQIARALDPKAFRETPVDPNDPSDESGLRKEAETSRMGRIAHVVRTIDEVLKRQVVEQRVKPAANVSVTAVTPKSTK